MPSIEDYRNNFDDLRGLDDVGVIKRVAEVDGTSIEAVMQHMGYEPEGDFGRQFFNSFTQTKQLGYGALAGAAATAELAFGEGGLATSAKKAALEKYKSIGEELQINSKASDSATAAYDMAVKDGDFGALVDFAQGAIGMGLGQIGQSVVTAGAGGLLGRAALKGTVERVTSDLVAKEAARLAEKKVAPDLIEKTAVSNVASRIGQNTAITAQVLTTEGGEIGGDLAQRATEEGRILSGAEVFRALGATIAAAGPEAITDRAVLDAMTGRPPWLKSLPEAKGVSGKAGRAAVIGGVGAGVGATQEAGQTYIEEFGKGNEINEQTRRMAIDAAAMGAIAGGIPGVVGGIVTRPAAPSVETSGAGKKNEGTVDDIIRMRDDRLLQLDQEERGVEGGLYQEADGTTTLRVGKPGRQLSPQEQGERLFLTNNPPEKIAARYGWVIAKPDDAEIVAPIEQAETVDDAISAFKESADANIPAIESRRPTAAEIDARINRESDARTIAALEAMTKEQELADFTKAEQENAAYLQRDIGQQSPAQQESDRRDRDLLAMQRQQEFDRRYGRAVDVMTATPSAAPVSAPAESVTAPDQEVAIADRTSVAGSTATPAPIIPTKGVPATAPAGIVAPATQPAVQPVQKTAMQIALEKAAPELVAGARSSAQRAQEDADQAARTSALPGIRSRQELDANAGGQTPTVVSISGLRHINDTYGRDKGDAVIKQLSAIVSQLGGYHLAGNDFVILSKNPIKAKQDAARLAEEAGKVQVDLGAEELRGIPVIHATAKTLPEAAAKIAEMQSPWKPGNIVEKPPYSARAEVDKPRAITSAHIMPKGITDVRILDDDYRSAINAMANELVEGGGVTYLRDEHDRITGRTGSVNPDWFKNDKETFPSVAAVRKAVGKALEGKMLGKSEQRIVVGLMNEHDNWVADNLLAEGRSNDYRALSDEERQAFGDPLYTPGEYKIAELYNKALDAGVDEQRLDAVLRDNRDDYNQAINDIEDLIDEEQAKAQSAYDERASPQERADADTGADQRGGETSAGVREAAAALSGDESKSPATGPFMSRRTRDSGAPGLELESYTEEGLRGQRERDRQAEKQGAKAQQDADKKAAADRERDQFDLTGSDRVADRNPNQGSLFSRRTAAASGERDLIIQHNLTAQNVLHADRMGGLPVPSLAVTNVAKPLTNFGEITLLGDSRMADPRSGTQVFGADIYSPRYPEIRYKLDADAKRRLRKHLEPFIDESGYDVGSIDRADDLMGSSVFQRYADATDGRALKYHELKAVAEKLLSDIGADERLFKGFTSAGDRRYTPHTLENVVKEMKKELRGGEGFNYGLPVIRANVTPRFRSLSEVRSEKGRMVSRDAFESVREEVETEMFKLIDQVIDQAGRQVSPGTVMQVLTDAARMGIPRALTENNVPGVGIETQQAMAEFMRKLRNMPTEYFEATKPRAVAFSEFRAAVVPSDADKRAVDVLRKAGLKIVEYDKKATGDRQRAIEEAAQGEDMLFSRNQVAMPNRITMDGQQAARRPTGTETAESVRAAIIEAHGSKVLSRLGDALVIPESWDAVVSDMEKRGSVWRSTIRDMAGAALVKGFYDPSTDTSYLIPENMARGEAASVFLHEVGVHYGLERMLGGRYDRVVRDVAGMVRLGGKSVMDAMRAVNSAEALGLDPDAKEFRKAMADRILADNRIAQEAMGYIVEQNANLPLSKRILSAIKAFLYKIGFVGKLDEGMLVDMAIRSARRGNVGGITMNGGQPLFSVMDRVSNPLTTEARDARPMVGDRFTLPAETRGQKIQRRLQDEAVRFQAVQDAVVKQGGAVDESTNVSDAIKRYPGRLAAAMKDTTENLIEPLMRKIHDAGATMDEVSLLAYAEFAPERNAEIAKINERFPNDGRPGKSGSGMTDQEAAEIIRQVRSQPNAAAMFALSEELRSIPDRNLDNLVAGGVMTQEQAYEYRAKSKHYVPLKGFELSDDRGVTVGTGTGLSTGSKLDFRALGRSSRAGQIFENTVRDYEVGLQLVEKANVAKVLRSFIKANPDKVLWDVDNAPEKPYLQKSGLVYQVWDGDRLIVETANKLDAQSITESLKRTNPETRMEEVRPRPNVKLRPGQFDPNEEIRFIENGKPVRIQLYDEGMVRSYNRLWHSGVSDGLTLLNNYNGWLRQWYTQKNPAWFVMNAFKDVQSVIPYVTGEAGIKVAAKVPLNIPGAFRAAWAMHHGVTAEGGWAETIKQFMNSGGYTGFSYVGDIEAQTLRLNGAIARHMGWDETLKRFKTEGIKKGVTGLGEKVMNTRFFSWIEALNSTFENMTRLAVFKAGMDSGMTANEAGKLAKNASTNFNTRGEWGPNINAVWLFANAGIQGTRNIGHALLFSKHKEQVWALMGGLAALGFMAGMMSDDDDDLLDDQLRSRYLAMKFGNSQVSIPMPYGFGFFSGFGQLTAQVIKHPEKQEQVAVKMASLAADHFSPLGNPLAGELDMKNLVNIAPTFPKPGLNVIANVSPFGGAPLYPDSPFDTTKPDSEKMWTATRGSGYNVVAEWLNTLTRGDKVREGYVSVSPEALKLSVSTMFGGAGRLMFDILSLPPEVASGTAKAKTIPIVKNFYREIDKDAYLQRFYEQAEKAQDAYRIFRNYQKQGMADEAIAYKNEESAYVAMGGLVTTYRKRIKSLRDMESAVNNSDASSTEKNLRLAKINAAIVESTAAFNDRLKALR